MDFDEYQKRARMTAAYGIMGHKWVYPAMGLSSEVGEVLGKLKKVHRDDHDQITEEKREDLKKELGDVLWYLAILSEDLGFSFQDIAEYNIRKLSSRKERNMILGSGDNR